MDSVVTAANPDSPLRRRRERGRRTRRRLARNRAGKPDSGDGSIGLWESTLMHILAGLDKPTSGSVTIADEPILVAGDAIASHEGQPMLGVGNADPQAAWVSLQRLASLYVEIACFGHGAPVVARAGVALAKVNPYGTPASMNRSN